MHCFVREQDCEGFLGRYIKPLEDTGRRLVVDVVGAESGTEVFVETVLVVFRIVLVDLEEEGMDCLIFLKSVSISIFSIVKFSTSILALFKLSSKPSFFSLILLIYLSLF